jgi:hypothetical protein
MNSGIEELANEFQQKARMMFDLRRTHDGSWCMMVPMGNIMVPLRGSIKPSIKEVLRYAIEKWDTRSPKRPFR